MLSFLLLQRYVEDLRIFLQADEADSSSSFSFRSTVETVLPGVVGRLERLEGRVQDVKGGIVEAVEWQSGELRKGIETIGQSVGDVDRKMTAWEHGVMASAEALTGAHMAAAAVGATITADATITTTTAAAGMTAITTTARTTTTATLTEQAAAFRFFTTSPSDLRVAISEYEGHGITPLNGGIVGADKALGTKWRRPGQGEWKLGWVKYLSRIKQVKKCIDERVAGGEAIETVLDELQAKLQSSGGFGPFSDAILRTRTCND